MTRGRLVTFEGGEGAGKSTCLSQVRAALEQLGVEVVQVREPGGTAVGEAIRELLLHRPHALSNDCELLLMFAARAQLVTEIVEPALARGHWVLSDRFTDSSFAYQGGGRGMDPAYISELERRAVRLRPDLTLLLDLPAAEGRARHASNRRDPDRIESERAEFFERVRATYLQRARCEPDRIRLIDASQDASSVAHAACLAVLELHARVGSTSLPGAGA